MKKMRDLAINPRKGRKKGIAVRLVVTTLPFFLFFAPSPKRDLGRMANLKLVDKRDKS
jgi:hypothetical protein